MRKIKVSTFRFLEETIRQISQTNLLLLSGISEKVNVRTIGVSEIISIKMISLWYPNGDYHTPFFWGDSLGQHR